MLEIKRFTDFPRVTMYDILCDAYSYDDRNKSIWDNNWKESDDFFYDNPQIADKYGLVTCIDGEPIGFVTWDPRNRPDYVEIEHYGIRDKYKRQGKMVSVYCDYNIYGMLREDYAKVVSNML